LLIGGIWDPIIPQNVVSQVMGRIIGMHLHRICVHHGKGPSKQGFSFSKYQDSINAKWNSKTNSITTPSETLPGAKICIIVS
jgi:hypothetical protein